MNFVDELKEYLATTPVEQQIKDWEDIKKDIPIDCGIIYFNPYLYEKEKANEQAKTMDEADKRKEALQNERELNPDTFTKEVSERNMTLISVADTYSKIFHDGVPFGVRYDAFIAGAKWQKEYWNKVMKDNHMELI